MLEEIDGDNNKIAQKSIITNARQPTGEKNGADKRKKKSKRTASLDRPRFEIMEYEYAQNRASDTFDFSSSSVSLPKRTNTLDIYLITFSGRQLQHKRPIFGPVSRGDFDLAFLN